MTDNSFSWIPIYRELAEKLLAWRDRQPELIAILREAKHAGFAVPSLEDEDDTGRKFPLEVIDPFTFFGAFNRRIKNKSRFGILNLLREKFALSSPAPIAFEGVPLLNPQQSRLFAYARDREPDAISALWDFAEAIVRKPAERVSPELFARCLKLRCVGPGMLTIGMFWMRPDVYFALDGENTKYFNTLGIEFDVDELDWAGYLALGKAIQAKSDNASWPQVSLVARETPHKASDGAPRYWLFQANPERYDLSAALRDGALQTWNVVQHKKEIHTGDRVVIWQSGADAGCYALATVTGEMSRAAEMADAKYWKEGAPTDRALRVSIAIDKVLVDAPVTKAQTNAHKDLQSAPLGRQGTNFTLTPEEFRAFEELAASPKVVATPMDTKLFPSRNIILYGPPGTGKTYRLQREYMKHFEDARMKLTDQERAAALVRDLSWWEVVALALLDANDNRAKVSQIVNHPFVQARWRKSNLHNPRTMAWAMLQSHTKAACPNVNYTRRVEPSIFWKDEDSTWSIDAAQTYSEVPELKKVLDAYRQPDAAPRRRHQFITFHQSYSYEDFVEGIKPEMTEGEDAELGYEIRPGVLLEIVREARENPSQDYALFIDEINRGNVANIFGELITLIEDDKRIGAANELTALLPYSRKEFGIPRNLYLIGTMNTADRSVEALDTALRRRFTFVEMRPNRELVPQRLAGGKLELRRMFDTINARLERLLDHDRCIGHAYFMDVSDLDALRTVFANKILPLLREYFYGNPAKVGMVLGESFVKRVNTPDNFAAGDWGIDELDEKAVWSFVDVNTLDEAAFASIYA